MDLHSWDNLLLMRNLVSFLIFHTYTKNSICSRHFELRGLLNVCVCVCVCVFIGASLVFYLLSFVVQSLSLTVTSWIVTLQAFLSLTISWSFLKLMSIESVVPSNHLVLCHPFLLPSIFPSITVFSSESTLHIRWPKYWNFSFSVSPSNKYSSLISFRTD